VILIEPGVQLAVIPDFPHEGDAEDFFYWLDLHPDVKDLIELAGDLARRARMDAIARRADERAVLEEWSS
jgi:hypothetical protein